MKTILALLVVCGAPAMAQRSVPELIEALASQSTFEHEKAIQELVATGSPAVPQLIAALEREELYIRGGSVRALGHIGDQRAFEPLMAIGRSGPRAERWAVVEALGNLGNPAAYGLLHSALDATEEPVVGHAALALGKLGDPRAISRLSDVVRKGRFEREPACSLSAGFFRPYSRDAAEAIAMLGNAGLERLLAMAHSETPEDRIGAAFGLAALMSAPSEVVIDALTILSTCGIPLAERTAAEALKKQADGS